MTTINDRIEELIKLRFNGNKGAFAEAIGMPPTSMSNYFGKGRRSKVSVNMLEKIVNVFDIDARWLLTGETTSSKIHTEGDYSPASDSGNISVIVNDTAFAERVRLLEQRNFELERENSELNRKLIAAQERIIKLMDNEQ